MEISREKFGEWSNTCPNKKEKKNDGQKKRTGNAFSFFSLTRMDNLMEWLSVLTSYIPSMLNELTNYTYKNQLCN